MEDLAPWLSGYRRALGLTGYAVKCGLRSCSRDSICSEVAELGQGLGATFLRVIAALLIGAAWTIPVGVKIGFSPRLARVAQPLAQIAASVPANAFFPVILLILIRLGGGLGIGSILLLLLGTQW